MDVYRLSEGTTPLLVSVPHAGTHIPPPIRARLSEAARPLPDTDWHVDTLYDFAAAIGAGTIVATHGRYVVDLNRDPAGEALYPGADNTGIVPASTFARAPIYAPGDAPDDAEVADRIARYWRPYHAALAATLEAVRARHGHAVLFDAHSIRSEVPRFFAGRLPDLNLGTADGTSAHPALEARAFAALSAAGNYRSVLNGRFKGGYITRHFGRPTEGIHALQLEISQRNYMDEDPPYTYLPARAEALRRVLHELLAALADWRPGP